MTLKGLENILKSINPRLSIRLRSHGDIAGLFLGTSYICRLTKGEIELRGYNDAKDPLTRSLLMRRANRKRGRIEVVRLLKKHKIIRSYRDVSAILYGVNYAN